MSQHIPMGYTAMEKQVRHSLLLLQSCVAACMRSETDRPHSTPGLGDGEQFFEEVVARGQSERVRIYEYFRQGWTFHGKGLWFTPAGHTQPILTMIGSPNFGTGASAWSLRCSLVTHHPHARWTGRRSTDRDLEAQVVMLTEDPVLRSKLAEV
jgi:hypothetical protein